MSAAVHGTDFRRLRWRVFYRVAAGRLSAPLYSMSWREHLIRRFRRLKDRRSVSLYVCRYTSKVSDGLRMVHTGQLTIKASIRRATIIVSCSPVGCLERIPAECARLSVRSMLHDLAIMQRVLGSSLHLQSGRCGRRSTLLLNLRCGRCPYAP